METKILFVCLGNICRSPAADGIMRHIVRERGLGAEIAVDSAGTYAGHTGELPDGKVVYGVDGDMDLAVDLGGLPLRAT